MSNDEADALMEDFDKWSTNEARKTFLSKMEHKFKRKKERYGDQAW